MIPHREFIAHLARVFGESENTIMLAHRVMREDGLVEGKQGRHSPKRGPEDAARFLCWIGISDKPSEAAAAVRDFGLSSRSGDQQNDLLRKLDLPPQHALNDMLAALVRQSAAGVDFQPYSVTFEPSDLSVAIDGGDGRLFYTRDRDSNADRFYARYAKPYRVSRAFDRRFFEALASPFRNPQGAGREVAAGTPGGPHTISKGAAKTTQAA